MPDSPLETQESARRAYEAVFMPQQIGWREALAAAEERATRAEAALQSLVGVVLSTDCYKHLPDAVVKDARIALSRALVPPGPPTGEQ